MKAGENNLFFECIDYFSSHTCRTSYFCLLKEDVSCLLGFEVLCIILIENLGYFYNI